ncbi:MAG: hypothetical protein IPK82_36725 [Polyangiaceae bacterium]|nr:hypothetical protein [Polyangiaceae bacterium]
MKLSRDQKRKKKLAKKAPKPAHHTKATVKFMPPQFDPALPRTEQAIEAALEAAMTTWRLVTSGPDTGCSDTSCPECGAERGPIWESDEEDHISPLQQQLFRLVFRREPGPEDPLFWDRERERHGVFEVRLKGNRRLVDRVLAGAGFRADAIYAADLTGVYPWMDDDENEDDDYKYDEGDLGVWKESMEDYRHQAATGVIPVGPWNLWGAFAEYHPSTSPSDLVSEARGNGPADDFSDLRAMLKCDFSDAVVTAFVVRLKALVVLVEEERFAHLMSTNALFRKAVHAASTAYVDRETGLLDVKDFERRLSEFETDPAD